MLTRFAADDLVAPRRCPGRPPLRLHRVRRLRRISRVAMALARRPASPCARLGLLGRGLAQHLSADPAREPLSPARRRGGIHRRVPRALPCGRALPARPHLAYSVAARRVAAATERRGLRPSGRPDAVRTSASSLTIFSPVPRIRALRKARPFPGSSAVEHRTVNPLVVGSIPTRGANTRFISAITLIFNVFSRVLHARAGHIYLGKVEPVEFESYESTEERFEAEVRQYLETHEPKPRT